MIQGEFAGFRPRGSGGGISISGETYEELCASHRWEVPTRYNIAADVCDKHPRDKAAMVWESFDGSVRELDWGSCRISRTRRRTHSLRGAWRGRPCRGRAAGDSRGGGDLLRRLEARRDPALDVGALRRRRRSSTGSRTPSATAARHRRRERAAVRPHVGADVLVLGPDTLAAALRPTSSAPTPRPTIPAQLYYTSGTTGLAKGIVHAHRYILAPRGVPSTATRSRTASASTGWASGPGPPVSRRCSAPGGSVRCSASTGARAASTRTSNSTSSAATG